MTKLARAVVATALPLLLLVGCTAQGDPDAEPTPTFSLNPSVPQPSATTLPTGPEIQAWADVVLPEDRAGGAAPVMRTSGALDPSAGALIDIAQASGIWEVLVTCQSTDVSPISWHIESPTSQLEWTDLACSGPGGAGTPTTTIIAYDGVDAQLNLRSTSDAVYAVEVRPQVEPLD